MQIAGSAYVILEVYMLAEWLRERDQRKEREAVERAEAEAQRAEAEARQRAEALRELNHKWRAWYWRQRAAFQDGRPFDEPPPGGPYDENDADEA